MKKIIIICVALVLLVIAGISYQTKSAVVPSVGFESGVGQSSAPAASSEQMKTAPTAPTHGLNEKNEAAQAEAKKQIEISGRAQKPLKWNGF